MCERECGAIPAYHRAGSFAFVDAPGPPAFWGAATISLCQKEIVRIG